MNKKNRRYATVLHPSIAAAVAGKYSFPSEELAKKQLQIFREYFVLSRQQNETSDTSILLWVKGYDVTPDEVEKGYTGNYAAIGMKKTAEGRYTLTANKVESELKFHPQRQRPKHQHPNWGHPILRAVTKKKIYATVEAAQAELQLLHEEFPEVTIPLAGKIYLIIYSRKQTPPAQKYVIEIKIADDGGFYLDAYPNDYKPKEALPHEKAKETQAESGELQSVEAPKRDEPKVAAGYFTSLVELRRAKKKRAAPAPRPRPNPEDVHNS